MSLMALPGCRGAWSGDIELVGGVEDVFKAIGQRQVHFVEDGLVARGYFEAAVAGALADATEVVAFGDGPGDTGVAGVVGV
jgi:hypothetical protein